jgi:uncharacterized protein (TIGR00369 family)
LSARTFSFKQMSELLNQIAFNAYLGVRLVRLHADGVTIECRLRPELMNASGVLHGGVTATLADVAVGMALARHLGRPRAATTVELKINYLRPVSSGRVMARSHLLRVGSTLCSGRVDLFDGDKNLVGAALVTYMLLGADGRGNRTR